LFASLEVQKQHLLSGTIDWLFYLAAALPAWTIG